MDRKNVYVRAREIVRELVPLLERIREHDAKLADQLRRAARRVEGTRVGMRSCGSLRLAGQPRRCGPLSMSRATGVTSSHGWWRTSIGGSTACAPSPGA